MSQNTEPPRGAPEPAAEQVEQVENAIELKEVAGLSQGQIVRRRFLRHRGAMAALVVLVPRQIDLRAQPSPFSVP